MKIPIIISFALLISIGAHAAVDPGDHVISNASVKHEVLSFKVNKRLIGATVEIYNYRGILVATSTVSKRKMRLSFVDFATGRYRIIVRNGDCSETLEYSFGYR